MLSAIGAAIGLEYGCGCGCGRDGCGTVRDAWSRTSFFGYIQRFRARVRSTGFARKRPKENSADDSTRRSQLSCACAAAAQCSSAQMCAHDMRLLWLGFSICGGGHCGDHTCAVAAHRSIVQAASIVSITRSSLFAYLMALRFAPRCVAKSF